MFHQNDPEEKRKWWERLRVLAAISGGIASFIRLIIELFRLNH